MANLHSSVGRRSLSPMFILSALLTLFTLTLLCAQWTTASDSSSLPKLLLISFDGFGWNFLSKLPASELPNFQAFMKKGVHVRWVENVFPTETRPNHMSLISGLYSESHGIVANNFYDPHLLAWMPGPGELKEDDSKWVDVGAEPVWVTNSKAGNGRRSGAIYWPCADAKIKGRMPDEIRKGEWTVSEEEFTPNQRISLALDWLTGKSTQHVNFVAVYMNEPDEISHRWGPDSPQVLEAIRSRDNIVKFLLSEIKSRYLEDELNVILTADHGQWPVYPEVKINIDLMIDPSWYNAYLEENGTIQTLVWPKDGFYQKVVDGLTGKHPNLHVATSSNSDDLRKLHYLISPRVSSVVLYTEPGWFMVTNTTVFKSPRGMHGWDPRYSPYMWPFFMAMGPAFKKDVRDAEPFHIVDIYPLMCHILGVKPAPNNGSLSKVEHILSSQSVEEKTGETEVPVNYTWVGIGMLVALLVVVVTIIVVRYIRNSKNVSASYKRTFARAGSTDDMMDDGMVVISDEEL